MSRHSIYRIVLLVVVVFTVLGLPIAAGAAAPNGITSVKDGATVSGKVEIKGNANDPNFSKWQLDLLPGGNADAAIYLASDTKSGEFSYTLDTSLYPNGDHALRLRVVRPDGNYSEYVTKVTIANPAAGATPAKPVVAATAAVTTTVATTTTVAAKPVAPVTATVATTPTVATTTVVTTTAPAANGITSPTNGATVSGKVEIKGNANDPNFSKWQLDLLPGGDANQATFLALGTVPGPFSYTLDTSLYPNGDYALRLRVVRSDSNYSEYATKITIANPAAGSSTPTVNIRGG